MRLTPCFLLVKLQMLAKRTPIARSCDLAFNAQWNQSITTARPKGKNIIQSGNDAWMQHHLSRRPDFSSHAG
jgi:hypothetical protein